MGLITGLLTLPLAPVSGTVALERVLEAEAQNQVEADESSMVSALFELEALRETGEFSDEELEAAENSLVEQLMAARGAVGREANGQLE